MKADKLIRLLGKRLGIASLSLDSGACAVTFEHDDVFFSYEEGILFVSAELSFLVENENIFRNLLEANYKGLETCGGYLGIDNERDVFTYTITFEGDYEYDFFEKKLAEFVRTLRKFKKYLNDSSNAALTLS